MITINYLAFAIPAFFLFVFIEYTVARKLKKQHLFNYESSVSNFSIGIAERLLNLFIAGAFYDLFFYIYKNYALFHIPNAWWVWGLIILATDFVWYWYHRLGHQVNFLWAAHIVHHQSEEFNLTVSARITTFQALIRNLFWCLLPLAGFHPLMTITILAVHGAYSFFTHTQLITKLGWLEHVLITPSLHGVHHASNAHYLDKNYGDVFVFWDKLFGTYQQEDHTAEIKYGLTHPIKSHSFLWQHFHYYLELIAAMQQVSGFKQKWKIFAGNPATLDQEIRPQLEKKYLQPRPSVKYRFKFRTYINTQLVICVVLLTLTTAFYSAFGIEDKFFVLSLVLITLINCGALMEQMRWIYYLECFRLIIISGYVLLLLDAFPLIFFPVMLLVTLDKIFSLQKVYKRHVLQYESIKI